MTRPSHRARPYRLGARGRAARAEAASLMSGPGSSDRNPVLAATAAALGIGQRHAEYAQTVLRRGIPKIIERVRDGELSIWAADKIVMLPAKRQKKLIEAGPEKLRKELLRLGGEGRRFTGLARAVAADDKPHDRAWFATRIVAAWRAAFDGVIETGRALIQAKAALAHGEFLAMVEKDLPFKKSAAEALMKIARDRRLTNSQHVGILPTSWGTLYELTKLDDATIARGIETGAIKPDMERREAQALRTGEKRVERLARAERLAVNPPEPLRAVAARRRYPVVYADPPWTFETLSEKGKRKSPENHYPTMTIADIRALPVGALAGSTGALFLWSTVPHLAEAIGLMEHWGFHYRSHLIWRKIKADGAPHRGTGFWFVNVHELLLLGVRGNMPAPLMGTQAESEIAAPVGRHSEKPEIFRQIIEAYFPDVGRLELFRRGAAPTGWDVWGNEASRSEAEAENNSRRSETKAGNESRRNEAAAAPRKNPKRGGGRKKP
jgi:N6-adenosine-specific RNA methylase IME4